MESSVELSQRQPPSHLSSRPKCLADGEKHRCSIGSIPQTLGCPTACAVYGCFAWPDLSVSIRVWSTDWSSRRRTTMCLAVCLTDSERPWGALNSSLLARGGVHLHGQALYNSTSFLPTLAGCQSINTGLACRG